jgi:hypothetical protein
VGAFLTVMVFMRRCGWISGEDITDLPKALDLFDALLTGESAQVMESKLQAAPAADGSFEAEQEIFHDMAIDLNAQISGIIGEARLFLSESV